MINSRHFFKTDSYTRGRDRKREQIFIAQGCVQKAVLVVFCSIIFLPKGNQIITRNHVGIASRVEGSVNLYIFNTYYYLPRYLYFHYRESIRKEMSMFDEMVQQNTSKC